MSRFPCYYFRARIPLREKTSIYLDCFRPSSALESLLGRRPRASRLYAISLILFLRTSMHVVRPFGLKHALLSLIGLKDLEIPASTGNGLTSTIAKTPHCRAMLHILEATVSQATGRHEYCWHSHQTSKRRNRYFGTQAVYPLQVKPNPIQPILHLRRRRRCRHYRHHHNRPLQAYLIL